MTTDGRRNRHHVARSARILSTGLSATAILGITAAFGAAERARSATSDDTTTTVSGGASTPTTLESRTISTPPALAPLGASAHTTMPPATTPTSNEPTPSPVGTITLSVPVADTVSPTTASIVAPIAAAEPPTELTLPPPPSNGSSGGSR